MDYKTNPIEFIIKGWNGSVETLGFILKDVKREIIFNDTMSLSFSTAKHVDNEKGYALVENENVISYQDHNYKIKQVSDQGDYKKVVCVHEFSDLAKVQIYDYLQGNMKVIEVLEFLFANTEWKYILDNESIREDSIYIKPEKFGASSVLKLLKYLLEISGLEFEILPNKQLSFSYRINGNEYVDYEYGKNIKSLSADYDSSDFYTRIRGYYSKVIDKDENGQDVTEWDFVEVTTPNDESKYGILEMDSLWNSDVKNADDMRFLCFQKLTNDFQKSINIEDARFETLKIGQSVNVKHPKVDIGNNFFNVRVLKITEGLIHNELKPVGVEIGNYFWEYFEERTEDRVDTLEKEVRNLKINKSSILISKFNIGNKIALALPGVIIPDVENPYGNIIAKLEYEEEGQFAGVFVTKRANKKDYVGTIITYDGAGLVTGSYDIDSEKNIIESLKLPSENVRSIILTISKNADSKPEQVFGLKFEGSGPSSGYFIESETVDAYSDGAIFNFTRPYDEVISVSMALGEITQNTTVNAYWSKIESTEEVGKFAGVSVKLIGLTQESVKISMQAVVKEVTSEEESGEDNG